MKNLIIKIIEQFEEMENNFDISLINTAMYLYVRYGKETTEKLSEEDIKNIYEEIQTKEKGKK